MIDSSNHLQKTRRITSLFVTQRVYRGKKDQLRQESSPETKSKTFKTKQGVIGFRVCLTALWEKVTFVLEVQDNSELHVVMSS